MSLFDSIVVDERDTDDPILDVDFRGELVHESVRVEVSVSNADLCQRKI